MVGRNSTRKQKRSQAITSARDDQNVLDELRSFWHYVPDPSPLPQVSNHPIGIAMTRTH